MKLTRYRIVRDGYAGFEVQKWRLWWPIWMQCWSARGMCNTHKSIEDAKWFIQMHKAGIEVWREE
jgi:hypothetical protein